MTGPSRRNRRREITLIDCSDCIVIAFRKGGGTGGGGGRVERGRGGRGWVKGNGVAWEALRQGKVRDCRKGIGRGGLVWERGEERRVGRVRVEGEMCVR